MGKYMRKTKITNEVALMEVAAIGVRTRAKTLALQRINEDHHDSSASYLELRSRRLEKPKNPNSSPNSKAMKKEEVEVEASFGENCLDFEAMDRNARETTPCSMIRVSGSIGTPGSTTKQTNSSNTSRRTQSSRHQNIPATHEMEEFFTCAERLQQRIFTDKYNFDPVNDCPLPGRYEWVKVE